MYVDERLKLYINKWVVNRVSYFEDLLYFQIHITNRCGNHCKHCYFREIPTLHDIDLNACLDFLSKCKSLALKNGKKLQIDFIGGDPLLYPKMVEISRFCTKNQINYGLKCNPNEISDNWDNVRDVVLAANDIMLSLDGLEQTNDYIRSPGNFSQTLTAIEQLKTFNKTVRIHFTASKHNSDEILPLFSFLLQEQFILDDFTWGRYWSEIDKQSVLNETDLAALFYEQISFLSNLFSDKNFYFLNADGRLVPRIFFGFKEHLWIPFFIENGILYDNVAGYILTKKDCINCTATKDVYIVDQGLNIYNCRKKMDVNNYTTDFFGGNQHKMVFTDFICSDCLYSNVCKSCYAIPKKSCLYYRRR